MSVVRNHALRSAVTSERLLTLQEAAAYLRRAPGTLKHWALQGRIEYTKPGKSMMFTRQALDDYIASKTVRVKVELP